MAAIKDFIMENQSLKNEVLRLKFLNKRLIEENLSLKEQIDSLLAVDDSLKF